MKLLYYSFSTLISNVNFNKSEILNVITFLFKIKEDQLPPTFKKDFIFSINLRNRNDLYIPRVKSIKIGMLPPHNFPKI